MDESIALTGAEKVRKTEAADCQRLPKMSNFGLFRTKIFSVSKFSILQGPKFRIFLTNKGLFSCQSACSENNSLITKSLFVMNASMSR